MTTLADALRADFERRHPRGKNTLLCVGLCRQRLDRKDFRETPWHGRAAACRRCEGMRYLDECRELYAWQLIQEREKGRALRRYVRHLRLRALLRPAVTSTEAFAAYEAPYRARMGERQQRFASAIDAALKEMTVKIQMGER